MRWPLWKASWIRPTTFSHIKGTEDSSRVAAPSQERRCSALTPDGPPSLFLKRWCTAHDTSSYSGTDSFTGNFLPQPLGCSVLERGGGSGRGPPSLSSSDLLSLSLGGGIYLLGRGTIPASISRPPSPGGYRMRGNFVWCMYQLVFYGSIMWCIAYDMKVGSWFYPIRHISSLCQVSQIMALRMALMAGTRIKTKNTKLNTSILLGQ